MLALGVLDGGEDIVQLVSEGIPRSQLYVRNECKHATEAGADKNRSEKLLRWEDVRRVLKPSLTSNARMDRSDRIT